MQLKSLVTGFGLALLAALPQSAQAQVKLELKYKEGAKQVVASEQKTEQKLTLKVGNVDQELDTKSQSFETSTTTTGKRADDGTLRVERKVDKLQTEVSLPGGMSLQFDSGDPDKKSDNPALEPLVTVLRATFKHPVTVVYDKDNAIKAVEFPEAATEGLPEAFKSQFDGEKRKKAMQAELDFLPGKEVKAGDTWERTSEADIGGNQIMGFTIAYEYTGTVEKDGKKLHQIKAKAKDVKYRVEDNAMLQARDVDLKIADSDISLLIDLEKGSVVERSSKMHIDGKMTLVINNMEFPGKLDLKIESKAVLQPQG